MIELFVAAGAVIAAFVAGIGVGAVNSATVTNAISVLKAAEQRAEATLTQITAHKAS